MLRFPLATYFAAALLLLGTACEGSNPLAPEGSGDPDLPATGSGFHESGAIESASPSGSDPSEITIVLGGDVRVQVSDETVIDAGGDLTTLDEVLAAIDAGIPVRIEIDGTIADGLVTATHVRFETDGVGAADDEVHAIVAAVDLGARTVTLADGRAIRVASDALIEGDGDFLTLSQVAAALAAGLEVRVEADLGPITDGVRDATSAKFESDQADGPGDDGAGNGGGIGDDPAPGNGGVFDEVHGIVSAVDLGARSVTLADGRVFRVADDASIETDGDFQTLAQVAAALGAGLEVRVEADLGAITGGVRDATSAKFESDQADGAGDDDNDGDNSGPGNGGDDDHSGPGNGGDDDHSGPGNGDDDDNSGPGHGDDDDDLDLDDDEVEGIVASVDLAGRTVTTGTGRVIRVESDATIEADGDILTLAEVAARLVSGVRIRVEADGATVGGIFVATQAKFEVDD